MSASLPTALPYRIEPVIALSPRLPELTLHTRIIITAIRTSLLTVCRKSPDCSTFAESAAFFAFLVRVKVDALLVFLVVTKLINTPCPPPEEQQGGEGEDSRYHSVECLQFNGLWTMVLVWLANGSSIGSSCNYCRQFIWTGSSIWLIFLTKSFRLITFQYDYIAINTLLCNIFDTV